MKASYNNNSVLISGAYGTRNLGDTKILEGLVYICREHYEDPKVIAGSVNPQHTQRNTSVDCAIPNIERDPVTWFKTIRDVDVVILGGGTTINRPAFTVRHSAVVLATRLTDTEVYVTAGADDIGGINRYLSAAYLDLVDGITVRDPRSKDILHSMDVNEPVDVVPDPGLASTETEGIEEVDLPDEYIIVSVSPTGREIDISGFASGLDDVNKKTSHSILFLPFHTVEGADVKLSNDIIDSMETDAAVITDPYTIAEAEKIIEKADAVVGMRLHSLILGAHMRTSIVAISYNPKCELFLDQINIEDYYECREISGSKISVDILEAIEQDFQNSQPASYVKSLEDDVSGIIAKCESQHRTMTISSRVINSFKLLIGTPISAVNYILDR